MIYEEPQMECISFAVGSVITSSSPYIDIGESGGNNEGEGEDF